MKRQTRIYRYLGIVGALCLPAVAAALTLPHDFTDGEVLSAQQLNDNFNTITEGVSSLEQQVADLEATVSVVTGDYVDPQTGTRYSSNAVYCGSTAATDGGIGGWTTVKVLCEAAPGCGAAAHMCSLEEIVRGVSTGGAAPPHGWFYGSWDGGAVTNCQSWTDGTAAQFANYWTGFAVSGTGCQAAVPVLCCE